MTTPQTGSPFPQKSVRLWPGVVAAVLLFVISFVVPLFVADAVISIVGGILCGAAIIIWWVFFSRAAWSDRLGVPVLMAIALPATSALVHVSISNGMMGNMLYVLSIPVVGVAIVAAAAIGSRLSLRGRRLVMCAAVVLAYGSFTLIRTGGISGDGDSDLHWRWTPTPEDRLLARAVETADQPVAPRPEDARPSARTEPAAAPSTPVASPAPEKPRVAGVAAVPVDATPATPGASSSVPAVVKASVSWPGFRGPDRNGIVHHVRIATDWSASPPVQVWRRPIGPGWSSFAVRGDVLYTQEQRGDDEVVAAYNVTTGEPVWQHRDPVRFWESNGGAGPRGTPTLAGGRLYAMGATGVLNALDAATGAVVWSRNAATDTKRRIPEWGLASSPLVIDNLVVIAVSGTLAAYDLTTGEPRWFGPAHGGSYSSPQLLTIDGVAQVVLLTGDGATSVAPADGALLWEYAWDGVTIVQPALIANGDILISTATAAGGTGIRRLAVSHGSAGWTVEERWTSNGLKPYFNDYVVHKGHAFGFDGSILACINLEDGKRAWKNGRYGNGQLVLLPDQDVLLVLSEDGELALVGATPDQFKEIARFRVLESKTWNHPVLIGNVLLIRNGEEMAAFRLSPESH